MSQLHLKHKNYVICLFNLEYGGIPGTDPGFQVRGGGALKKIATSGGRRENFWGILCERSRFYAKKNHIYSNFRGGGGGGGCARVRAPPPPPWIRSCIQNGQFYT